MPGSFPVLPLVPDAPPGTGVGVILSESDDPLPPDHGLTVFHDDGALNSDVPHLVATRYV